MLAAVEKVLADGARTADDDCCDGSADSNSETELKRGGHREDVINVCGQLREEIGKKREY